MNDNRVVVTGMGIIAPNGLNLNEFCNALKEGKSGIHFVKEMEEMGFRCNVAGNLPLTSDYIDSKIPGPHQKRMGQTMIVALLAAMECVDNAGFSIEELSADFSLSAEKPPKWDIGCIVGAGTNGTEILIKDASQKILSKNIKRLGISIIEKTMTSGVSSKIAGVFGLGNKVTTNSSACCTGAEAILDAYYHIKSGRAKAMICGGAEGGGPYVWAGFDAMRILNSKFNDTPEKAARPFSVSSNTFIPGSGAGLLFLETLESARQRGAKIYAEILGGASNCGGQRLGGTMTAPNSTAVKKCIKDAMKNAKITAKEIDYINGHLTGTKGDPIELINWQEALGRDHTNFPYINGTKALIGHGIGAAGALEMIATILQLKEGFIHSAINSEDLYPELANYRKWIPLERVDKKIKTAIKASFGFGDVNCVLIARRWDE